MPAHFPSSCILKQKGSNSICNQCTVMLLQYLLKISNFNKKVSILNSRSHQKYCLKVLNFEFWTMWHFCITVHRHSQASKKGPRIHKRIAIPLFWCPSSFFKQQRRTNKDNFFTMKYLRSTLWSIIFCVAVKSFVYTLIH